MCTPRPVSHPKPATSPARVLLVDDHAPTLAAVAALIAYEYPRFEVAGTATRGSEALHLAQSRRPDLIVLDLDLDGECGLDLLPALAQAASAPILIFTACDDPAERQRALRAGAAAWVHKFAPADDLLAALVAAFRAITTE